jgi:hypothetical protein
VPDFNTQVPHIARIYDYWLGGKDNFAADREAAERALAAAPAIRTGVHANRRFLGRTVRYMAGVGIRQFLDIGTGIPTANNTHQVAQSVAPDAKVVYVDNDPIVLSHARALLKGTTAPTAYIDADARDTEKILEAAADTLDFSQPVGVMLIAVLHCIPDEDDPRGLVRTLMDAVPAGSYLAISHPYEENHPHEDKVPRRSEAAEMLSRAMGQKVTLRVREQVAPFFDGLELVEPGLVPIQEWRPDSELDTNSPATNMNGGLARKP